MGAFKTVVQFMTIASVLIVNAAVEEYQIVSILLIFNNNNIYLHISLTFVKKKPIML